MAENEPVRNLESKLYDVPSPEGPCYEVEVGTHRFTSWPNADLEEFLELSALSEEKEAAKIHFQNRLEGGLLSLTGLAMGSYSASELAHGGSPWYVAGVVGGAAIFGAGFRIPHDRTTLETQQIYRDIANAIRATPRRVQRRRRS